MQGWRTEMEDAHISIDMPSKPDHTFLAVFDGYVSF
jgi:serine/threonine protein phosphatase PrpC